MGNLQATGESLPNKTWLDYHRRNCRKLHNFGGTRLKMLTEGDIPLSKDMKQEARSICCSEQINVGSQTALNVLSPTRSLLLLEIFKNKTKHYHSHQQRKGSHVPIEVLLLDPEFSLNCPHVTSCITPPPSHFISLSLKGKGSFDIAMHPSLQWMP